MAMLMESARSRLPPVTEQKMPTVQMSPTCITVLLAEVWLNLGVAAVPLVVCAKVTDHGDCSVSVGVVSGEVSQMKSTRPVVPEEIEGTHWVPLALLILTGEGQAIARWL